MADERPQAKISQIFEEGKDSTEQDWLKESDGQLALDGFQTSDNVIIKAPIAGVKPDELEVSITDDNLTIQGERKQEHEIEEQDFFAQECYWGAFSRSLTLPPGVQTSKAKASLKHGVLTIIIPKEAKSQTKVLKVETE